MSATCFCFFFFTIPSLSLPCHFSFITYFPHADGFLWKEQHKTNSKEFLSEANSWSNDKQTGEIAAICFSWRPFCKLIGFGTGIEQRAGQRKNADTFTLSLLFLKQEVVAITWCKERKKDGWQMVVRHQHKKDQSASCIQMLQKWFKDECSGFGALGACSEV